MTDINKSYRMAGIGEILWDLLPDGKQLGGSPMNVVYHCQAAGIESVAVSAIGNDELGFELLKQVSEKNNSTEFIQKLDEYPTGTVSVKLNEGIPDFTIHNNVAWDHIKWNGQLKDLAGKIDAVAFGSLAQRNSESASTIKSFINNMKPGSIKVFDINLRQDFHSRDLLVESLEMATILKINEEELPVLANYLDLHESVYQQIKKIIELFSLDLVAYTKGSNGSVLYSPALTSVRSAPSVQIQDTVGAGDTFTGVMIAGLLNKKNLEEIHTEAIERAAWVCTQEGGTPPYSRHKAEDKCRDASLRP